MTTTAEETTVVPVNLEDDVTCEVEWRDHGECGRVAGWRATVHNIDCVMEQTNICTDCMVKLKLASLICVCPVCQTRDLLRDIRKL